ncbi:MAG: hypothetical protein ACRDPR_05940 [Nocardioidaceae bacterium]
MYFPSAAAGIVDLVLEVIANGVDLVLAGTATHISVDVEDDGAITVSDDGPGLPVHATVHGRPSVEEVFTVLHRTPTADGHYPHVHLAGGFGLAPVTAACRSVEVETRCADGVYRAAFAPGVVTSALARVAPATGTTGTAIRLVPDAAVFGDIHVDRAMLCDRLRALAWIHPGLVTELDGERFGPVVDLTELFAEVRGDALLLHPGPFHVRTRARQSFAHVALGWQRERVTPRVRAYCNFREMTEGGTHLVGIEEGLRRALDRTPINGILEGLVAALHVVMLDPEVGGPTRGRLDSPEAVELVADAIASSLPAQLRSVLSLSIDLRTRRPDRGA